MENLNNNTSVDITALVNESITEQREIQKQKNWKLSELAKVKKAQSDEISLIDNAFRRVTKEMTDGVAVKRISLGFEAKKLEVEQEYAPKIEAFKVDIEELSEAIGSVTADKLASAVAPVTKGVMSFCTTFAKRAGITK